MIRTAGQSGFSAVELLITLFIAAAFVATGYQLRRYSPQATSPCSAVTASPTPTRPSDSNLPNASISVVLSCPYGTSTSITKVTATVTYGNPQESVVHVLFVND
jgi:prepilin-type N-terminal cleavage/methylation domain-containing protein